MKKRTSGKRESEVAKVTQALYKWLIENGACKPEARRYLGIGLISAMKYRVEVGDTYWPMRILRELGFDFRCTKDKEIKKFITHFPNVINKRAIYKWGK